MSASAIIFGCAGPKLSAEEKTFFIEAQPWGFILFARNLQSPDQVKKLTADLRNCVAHNPHIFIDEEGGRVSRLRTLGGWIGPPVAKFLSCNSSIGATMVAIRANYRAIGARLAELGISADCAPVLDVPVDGADPIIGDRAFAFEPDLAGQLAGACLDGLHDVGIAGVIKHIPGHGRADVDSHLSLPVVQASHKELSKTDFVPFQALRSANMAMTAHVVYADIDPDHPATTSRAVIQEIIRDEIGFDGLLMSDDLDMKALAGSLQERGEASMAAGCDMLLHCSGDLAAMQELAEIAPKLVGKALQRAIRAHPLTAPREPICIQKTIEEAEACLRALG
jgi:beta-N-acetylhexosaminidase